MYGKLSVIVPVLNEAESLPELYRRLTEVLGALPDPYELIFVDDGSTDDSFAVLASLQQDDAHVAIVQLRRTYGKATALAAGFEQAEGERILTIDADLQDQPEEIPKIIAKLEEGYDLVSGWRSKREDGRGKVLASRVFNVVTGWLSGVRLHDMNCGLKIFKREVVDGLRIRGEFHRYIPVLAQSQGFKVAEVAVDHRPRRYGTSKYGSERFVRGFLDVLTVMILTRYLRRPMHLFGGLGLALTLVGLALNSYLTIGWIMGKWWLGERPLLLLGALLMILGVQFVLFGLLAEITVHDKQDDIIRARVRTAGAGESARPSRSR